MNNWQDIAFISYKGRNFEIEDGKLNLCLKGIEEITDINWLDKSEQIFSLDLSQNEIFDIRGLKSLTNLKMLDLSHNFIVKIEGLKTLKNLKELDLHSNKILEIEGFELLKNLEVLNLCYNEIIEIKGLDSMVNLRVLILSGNHLMNLKGIENLQNLSELHLHDCPFTEIPEINGPKELKILGLNRTRICDINSLRKVPPNCIPMIKDAPITREVIEKYNGIIGEDGRIYNFPEVLSKINCNF
jgi:Leucine-rich repeat (LRR) protein